MRADPALATADSEEEEEEEEADEDTEGAAGAEARAGTGAAAEVLEVELVLVLLWCPGRLGCGLTGPVLLPLSSDASGDEPPSMGAAPLEPSAAWALAPDWDWACLPASASSPVVGLGFGGGTSSGMSGSYEGARGSGMASSSDMEEKSSL